MPTCIALLRGINVGRAKRIPMADLRALAEGLGYANVRTLLASGNVVFEAPRPNVVKIAGKLEAAIAKRFGFEVPVVVVTAKVLKAIAEGNPLAGRGRDPSRLLVAFFKDKTASAKAKILMKEAWAPDELTVGPQAAYLWCVEGVLDSPLSQAFAKAMGAAVTSRNWATVEKLREVARV